MTPSDFFFIGLGIGTVWLALAAIVAAWFASLRRYDNFREQAKNYGMSGE